MNAPEKWFIFKEKQSDYGPYREICDTKYESQKKSKHGDIVVNYKPVTQFDAVKIKN